ncbi:hypothetical protein HDU77_003753 [Chytriomyces hyalinus]|nr:hypothetical protein HDU77_003753 [Chytriomyces hyalinus]
MDLAKQGVAEAQAAVQRAQAAVKEALSDAKKANEELNKWKADNPGTYAGPAFDALNTAVKEAKEAVKERRIALKEREVALEKREGFLLALDSKKDCIETLFSQFKISGMDGIDLDSPHLHRVGLLESIVSVMKLQHFVLLTSPAGSGKTSVLQMIEQWVLEKAKGVPCIYVLAKKAAFCSDLLKQAGIDMATQTFNGTTKELIVMIDDAQKSFHDQSGWELLIKGVPRWMKNKKVDVRFIISATHSLKGGIESPPEFNSIHAFRRQHFLLSEIEATAFLDSPNGLRDDMKFESLKETIIAQCGGLVGALRMSVDSLSVEFAKSQPSETEALQYYLSGEAAFRMARVFGSDHIHPVGDIFKNFLGECFTSGVFTAGMEMTLDELSVADKYCFTGLQKAGILVEEDGIIKFSSIMSERYYLKWLFPDRSPTLPKSLRDLTESCIENMSCNLLARSVVDGFPKEATFQHLFMKALAKFTTATCSICPKLSKAFPGANQSGGKIAGEVDFYLDGSLRWGIELMVNGRSPQEHLSRFETNGKYFKLNVRDYVVIDFRSNATGEPTFKNPHEKKVSVFFKHGVYSVCKCVFGLDPAPKELQLQR